MKFKREIVTPYLVFIFIVVGFSGILMFFHLADAYTNVVHEFLGLAFALFAILHVTINWKSIRNYADKRLLLAPGIVILIISIAFVTVGKMKGNLEQEMLEKMLHAPAYSSFKVLNGDYKRAASLLESNHITVKDSLQSLEDIGRENEKPPEEMVELIMREN